jgi:hypothetical protein
MPRFIDVHNLPGATAEAVAEAHERDLEKQGEYDVNILRYWFDQSNGKVFCLIDAPSSEAANRVHAEAHGLVADEIYEVQEG